MNFVDTIIEKLGNEVLARKSETLNVIPTGSTSLDMSIGVGGIPRGRITEIYGPEGSGKTSLCLSIARSAIEQGLKVLYYDAEYMLGYDTVEDLLGKALPEESLIIVHPETAEDGLLACEIGIRSGEFGCIIVDSVGALSSAEEQKKDLVESTVGKIPLLMSKWLRRNTVLIGKNDVAVIFINQIRDVIGSYVKSVGTPGGHALKHFSSVRVALSKGDDIKQGSDIIGINVRYIIKKNKLASPFRSFYLPLMFGKGIDSARDLLTFSELLGVVKRKGSYYIFEEITLGQGMNKAAEFLFQNKDLLEKIRLGCYNVAVSDDTDLLVSQEEDLQESD